MSRAERRANAKRAREKIMVERGAVAALTRNGQALADRFDEVERERQWLGLVAAALMLRIGRDVEVFSIDALREVEGWDVSLNVTAEGGAVLEVKPKPTTGKTLAEVFGAEEQQP